MTRKSLVTFSLWTLATAGGMLIALGPSSLVATDAPATEGRGAEPKIERDGTSLAVHLTNAGVKGKDPLAPVMLRPTDHPALKVTASNASDQTRHAAYTLRIYAFGPRNPLARTVAQPKTIWERTGGMDLVAGAEQSIDLTADVRLAQGNSYTVELAMGEDRISPIRFAVPDPNARLAVARR